MCVCIYVYVYIHTHINVYINVCKNIFNIFTVILKVRDIMDGFLEDVSITLIEPIILIDETDISDLTKRETFWMH